LIISSDVVSKEVLKEGDEVNICSKNAATQRSYLAGIQWETSEIKNELQKEWASSDD
jgi:hypothetical protein